MFTEYINNIFQNFNLIVSGGKFFFLRLYRPLVNNNRLSDSGWIWIIIMLRPGRRSVAIKTQLHTWVRRCNIRLDVISHIYVYDAARRHAVQSDLGTFTTRLFDLVYRFFLTDI